MRDRLPLMAIIWFMFFIAMLVDDVLDIDILPFNIRVYSMGLAEAMIYIFVSLAPFIGIVYYAKIKNILVVFEQ